MELAHNQDLADDPDLIRMCPTPIPESKLDCPFCRIASASDPASILHSTEEWIGLQPLNPATSGHILIIPRAHFSHYWELPTRLAESLSRAALLIGRAISEVLNPAGMNLITSAGAVAEQTVNHVHLHVVPRFVDDGFGPIWPPESHAEVQLDSDLLDRVREAYHRVTATSD